MSKWELREALRNMAFPSEWTPSGQAPLAGGVYEEPPAQDLASKNVIRLTEYSSKKVRLD